MDATPAKKSEEVNDLPDFWTEDENGNVIEREIHMIIHAGPQLHVLTYPLKQAQACLKTWLDRSKPYLAFFLGDGDQFYIDVDAIDSIYFTENKPDEDKIQNPYD